MELVLSTNMVHERDRISTWEKWASEIYFRHDFSSDLGSAFEGVIRAGRIGSLGVSMLECSACSGERSHEMTRRERDDRVFVGFQIDGTMDLRQDGRSSTVTPKSLVLIDPRRPCSVSIPTKTRSLVFEMPRAELQARLGDISSFTAIPVSTSKPTASLAIGFLSMAVERASAIRKSAADAKIAQQMVDLIALAFETEGGEKRSALSASRRATLLRLKAIIEGRLRDPAFKPAHAASSAGISVRYANVLLADEGTSLERYIVRRRLENCRQTLLDPAHASRTVSDIAYSWGFADLSHFNRRFKSHFGCAPGRCREFARSVTTAGSEATASTIECCD